MADNKTFTGTAKTLHWLIAILIFLVLIFGLGLEDAAMPERLEKLQGHSGLGLVILTLVVFRIIWRRSHPAPALPDTMTERQKKWAERNVRVLYGLMLYQPIVGMLHAATYADGDVKPFGAFNLTALLPSSESITQVFHVMHALGAFAFILLLTLHVLAAFKHLIIDRDKVMQRILPFGKG